LKRAAAGDMRLEHSRSKFIQAKPNKTKQKSLDLLGFLWSNRGFSMGYGESKGNFFQDRRRSLRYAPKVWLGLPPPS
jgi:hypothetical protein